MKTLRLILIVFSSIFCYQISNASNLNYFEEGLELAKKKDFQQAKIKFNSYLIDNKNDANTLYNLGLIEFHLNDFPTAIWYFEQSLKINPKLIDSKLFIERSYKKLNLENNYEAPISIFLNKLFEIKLEVWTWISLTFSVIFSTILVIHFLKQNLRSKTIFALLFSAFVLIFSLIIRTNQYNYIHNFSHAIVKQKVDNSYLDKSGNAIENINLNAGERFQINEIFPKENRISLVKQNEELIFIDLDKVLLF
jgi:tetratricopeptide (TPR) repeat protein